MKIQQNTTNNKKCAIQNHKVDIVIETARRLLPTNDFFCNFVSLKKSKIFTTTAVYDNVSLHICETYKKMQ
jgi:hypothetical protein